ncbi:MAG TPA: trypsin-like peptidase domain-containing protein [Candidatus Aquilonibacter sp.]
MALAAGVAPPISPSGGATRVVLALLLAVEGFFTPAQTHAPFDQTHVLRSLVRITANIYWDTIVLNDQPGVDTLKQSFTLYPGTGRKSYLPQGVVLWHIIVTKQQLLAMMEDPNSAYEVGIADIVRSFKGVTTFPAERIVPLTGWANATFISRDGLLLTNYHVVREQIEALGRERGCAGTVPAAYLHAEIPRVSGNQIVGWIPVQHLDLVANLSATDWQSGMDGALLQMRDNLSHDYLQVRETAANVGEPIWLYGFPFATNRNASALQRLGYENADQSLRVSIGNVTQLKGPDFLADADGTSGDSGGAMLDARGALLGYDWDVEGQDSDARLTSFSGGDIAVWANGALQRLLRQPPCDARGANAPRWGS